MASGSEGYKKINTARAAKAGQGKPSPAAQRNPTRQ